MARHYGVRTDRYKLIHYYTTDEWELFDLDKDPGEMKSVYNNPEYGETKKTLERELARLRHLYKVPNNKEHRTNRERDRQQPRCARLLPTR